MLKINFVFKKIIYIFLFLAIFLALYGIFNSYKLRKINQEITNSEVLFNDITIDALNKSRKQADSLSSGEKESILKYINDEYYLKINGYLRKEIPLISDELKNDIKNIENALNKAYLPEDTLLYRSVKGDFIENVFFDKKIADLMKKHPSNSYKNLERVNSFLTGKIFVERGFMSTSYNINETYVAPIRLKINAPKGSRALALDGISTSEEEEVLINRCTIWKIKSVNYGNMGKKRIWDIVLEAIPNISNSIYFCGK